MSIIFNPLLGSGLDFSGDADSPIISGTTPIIGVADHAILINSGNLVGSVGPLTNGQLLIGSTGANPVAASLTGSTSIGVTPAAGSVTLAVPAGGISNTEVASGIDAVKIGGGAVSNTEFSYLDGVTSAIQTQFTNKISTSEKAANNGVATLDAGGKVPVAQLPNTVMEYQGAWDASTNTPTLIDGTGNAGDVYRVSVAASRNLGSGAQAFLVGEFVIYSGTIWERAPASDGVISVNSQQGVVSLTTTNIPEGTNLYFTNALAQGAITGGASTIVTSNLTASRALASDGSGKVAVSAVTSTELGYVGGVTSAIQTQLGTKLTRSSGDIDETSFSAANNQAAAANVTGLVFANGTVRSFNALVSIYINATASLYEVVNILGIQRGADWVITSSGTGDNSGVNFSITNAGQIQYTSTNNTGFTAATMKFRASTTSI
jgi:hypothetical protein